MKRVFLTVAVLLTAACIASLFLGEYRMAPSAVVRSILSARAPSADSFITQTVRAPRILAGLITGFAFGVSGAMLQSLLRNPLADSGVLGVNDGAGLSVTLFLVALPQASGWLLPGVAFAGAVVAICLLLALTSDREHQPTALLLNGIGLSLGFYAVTKIAKTVGDWQRVQSAIAWLQGNLTGVSWPQVTILLPWLLTGVAMAVANARLLEVHELGDDIAIGLGSRLSRERVFLLGIVAVLTGSAISITGPVYFVGFLSGNLARRLAATSARAILLLSGLIGALIVVIADLLARTVVAPREIRLLFLINLVGGPALALLSILKTRVKEASFS